MGLKKNGLLSCFMSMSALCFGLAKKLAVGAISCVNPVCVLVSEKRNG